VTVGYVDDKDDSDYIKCCRIAELDGIRLMGQYQRLLYNVMHTASKPDGMWLGCDAFLPPARFGLT